MTNLLQVRHVVTSKLALTCCKLVSHLHSCRVDLAASSASFLQTKIAIWVKAFLRKPCGNGFRNGLSGNAFVDSLWKVKWQPSMLSGIPPCLMPLQ
ncbi:hypothetical protein AVEN_153590-1 [Araneus ventricosus]|uniref:Uncharacterized protein n=1 Tax=Araneus ventricosus TaxID=182803 RepID=A0A4Y2BRJ6_ARAVE|nr:hypothetical protein AVEN_153590-1 [Araneus ventricosus]